MKLSFVSRSVRASLVCAGILLTSATLSAQAPKVASASARAKFPLTRPEATDYAETSRYDDVIA